MTGNRSPARQRVAVLAAPAAQVALEPLLAAYRGPVGQVEVAAVPTVAELTEVAADVDAVLLVGPRRRSPRTVLAGPLLYPADGRRVPVGWLPDVGPAGLRRFALAAARVHGREGSGAVRSAAMLGQRSRRYEDLSARISRLLAEGERPLQVFGWTADQLVRDDMLAGIGCGLAAGIYVGHGRPVGWVGYRGTRAHHLADVAEPAGAIFSLTCNTASRKRVGVSFSESIPLLGAAGAAFGAVTATLHTDNSRWALRLARALTSAAPTLGEAVAAAIPHPDAASSRYRILGDPLIPLLDAPGAAERARALTRAAALEHAS